MTIYKITGRNEEFRCLRSAKQYIYKELSQEERIRLNGGFILKIRNEEVITKTPIIVTTDGYSFGKTKVVYD